MIRNGKTALKVSHEKYFVEKFMDAGLKLDDLSIHKNILSEDEKNLLIQCSTNVRYVNFYHLLKIDGWCPEHKIEEVWINISNTIVSRNEFKSFYSWIQHAENLNLELHDETNYIGDICVWLRHLKFKRLSIIYRGKSFKNIEELKKYNFFLKIFSIFKYFQRYM